jgi:nitrate/TMAO reductase-like tetraheme cytochrome c subunit
MKRIPLLLLLVASLLLLTVGSFANGEHAKVGPERCKMCHSIQYNSWVKSKHATVAKLDCEGCHGNGGDYWHPNIMKDLPKAKAAGLILPTKEFCSKCHGKNGVPAMTDALFAKVHAHKAK